MFTTLDFWVWVASALLALAYGMAGVMKTFRPIPDLAKMMVWPGDVPVPMVRFVGVVEIAGAVMTFIEAVVRTATERHHTLFYVLLFVQPVILLLFGIFDVRFAARRAITADDDGVALRFRLLFGRRIPWRDIGAFRIRGEKLELILAGGRTRALNLRDLKNRDEAVAWLSDQLRRRGIEELPLSG